MELPKIYDPKKVEDKIYNLWLKSGFLNPDKLPRRHKKPFTIVIPLPNITGTLHMGHALNATIQDILIRWKRLQGYKTLWLPGTDHAGIATQVVVEKELKKEGISRFDLGQEKFIEKVWQWRQKYGSVILDQLKKLGCSLDWSRNRFTMDNDYSRAVREAFLHYYKKGWVYKGKRVINWCTRCKTSLSDLELEYQEEKGKLWYIRYPLKRQETGDKRQDITVATTRPETMLGDTAVAVNPKDIRYKNLIGKVVILPLTEREIPIIADELVDPKFGTGAVKVTPAHDLTDCEIGLKHKLESIQVIDEKGEITKEAPLVYQGLKVLDARQMVIEDLKNKEFLEKVEEYTHQIPKCHRCHATIELIPSEQWFLKMKDLAKMAKILVKKGKIKFHPKNFEKGYFDWLKNIKDWCISRQIWWGHKIPISGENDVLDTWFSSALWPFATLGWPKKTKDLKTFYPTDVLVTARDIINLWVARMIFSGVEFMKKIPFQDVYIHATVLTKEGKRMSKSLGTGIDPLNLVEKYGADATRFGLCWQITGLQDIRFSEEHIIAGRKFCNKLWNASRFVLLQIPPKESLRLPTGQANSKFKNLTVADKKIIKILDKTIKLVNKDLDNFRFGPALWKIYHFFWHDFCDKYIEQAKIQMTKIKNRASVGSEGKEEDEVLFASQKENTKNVLLYVLLTSLKLLHPFMPFITEEIYQKLPLKKKVLALGKNLDPRPTQIKKLLIIESWPR